MLHWKATMREYIYIYILICDRMPTPHTHSLLIQRSPEVIINWLRLHHEMWTLHWHHPIVWTKCTVHSSKYHSDCSLQLLTLEVYKIIMMINFCIPLLVNTFKYLKFCSKCSYVLYVIFAYMPHTCVLIELDSIFILQYICMILNRIIVYLKAHLKSAM